MRHSSKVIATAAGLAVLATAADAKCTRLGFSVNDYGKAGPTKDAKDMLDKYIAKWTADRGIKTYTTGKKDVKCELYLDVGLFDEHTCRAEASVCWGDGVVLTKPVDKADPVGTLPAKASPAKAAVKPAAAPAKALPAKSGAVAPAPAAAMSTGTISAPPTQPAIAAPIAPPAPVAPAAAQPAALAAPVAPPAPVAPAAALPPVAPAPQTSAPAATPSSAGQPTKTE